MLVDEHGHALQASMPLMPELKHEVQHAITEAFGDLVEKVRDQEEYFKKAEAVYQEQQRNQPKAWFCVPGDHDILIRSGRVSVAECWQRQQMLSEVVAVAGVGVRRAARVTPVPSDESMIWTGTKWSPCRIHETGARKLCTTTVDGGYRIKTSPEHRFLTIPDDTSTGLPEWRAQRVLKLGDLLLMSRACVEFAGNDMSFFAVGVGSRGKSFEIDHADEAFWELAGWWLGDGSIERGLRASDCLTWIYQRGVEDGVAQRHRGMLERLGLSVSERRMLCSASYGGGTSGVRLRVAHDTFVEYFEHLGFLEPKTTKKFVPASLFKESVRHRAAFLRGYFSADGTASGGQVAVSLRSKRKDAWVASLQSLLLTLGIRSRWYAARRRLVVVDVRVFGERVGFIQSYKNDGTIREDRTGSLAEHVHPVFCRRVAFHIQNSAGFDCLTARDRARVKEAAAGRARMSGGRLRALLAATDVHAYDDVLSYFQVKVTGIKRTGANVPMYDVEVLDDQHQFVGDGVVLHNSDPFALLDSLGMGYRAHPSYLTYDTLRAVSERDTVTAAIIGTRINQVASFARPQENKYSVGFTIRRRGRDKKRRLSDSERDRVDEIEHFLRNTGIESNLGHDSFATFLKKIVRDRLTYDQVCVEKVKTRSGRPHSFYAVPADTIRIAHPAVQKGTPPEKADIKRQLKYVQLLNAQIVVEFTMDEMMFAVANPRTHVKVYGYGFPEIETLMTTVTSHMWAEEWNRRAFSQGSTVKGILNVKGQLPLPQFEMFKRQWYAQVSGVQNAWKTPVLNTEGLEWLQMQMTNVEMGYQMWMEYLIKIASAIFQIDPAEINFDLRGSSQQQPLFMSTNEAQQKVSKDRGLVPLLCHFEDNINKHFVWQIDDRFELAFVGLDAKTEDQAQQLRMQQVQNTHTLNEVRALEDLPPLPEGDMVLNPVYAQALQQKQAAEQQQQMMAGQGGGQPQPGGDAGGDAGGAPPGGGQPGQPPPGGQPGQPQAGGNGQPYQNRFQGKPPGDEEKQGVNRLHGFLQRGGDQEEDKAKPDDEDNESGEPVDERTRRYLDENDWASSVHSSLRGKDDLRKAEFDLIDLD
jgi:hypothetical protein